MVEKVDIDETEEIEGNKNFLISGKITECTYRQEDGCHQCKEGVEVILSGKVDENNFQKGYFVEGGGHCWFNEEWLVSNE